MVCAIALGGCGARGPVMLLSYNVQNLFDATDSGIEYPEYRPDSGWDRDRYHTRLIRLGRVLSESTKPPPHLIALQEIEGASVVTDLLDDYLGTGYQAVVPPPAGSNVTVALLSRLPLHGAVSHHAEILELIPGFATGIRPPEVRWRGRAMLEVTVEMPEGTRVGVVVCHWKSQSGGEEATESRRILEASLIATVLADVPAEAESVAGRNQSSALANTVLIVGDLNEDVQEFAQHSGSYRTALMPEGEVMNALRSLVVTANPDHVRTGPEQVVVFSPWLSHPNRRGTYYHAGRWERLDQALVAVRDSRTGLAPVVTLDVVDAVELVDQDGRPRRYDPRTSQGYSDHLPILVEIFSSAPDP